MLSSVIIAKLLYKTIRDCHDRALLVFSLAFIVSVQATGDPGG